MQGVYRTRVGYAGGNIKNPTYHRLGDHTETLQIDYDPQQITYQEILQIFWDNHNPFIKPWSKQYMSVIFYHNKEQYNSALDAKSAVEMKTGKQVYTEILTFEEFYLAEDYHQKYYLQGESKLYAEMRVFYPKFIDFVNSPTVSRLNGFVAGYGSADVLSQELDDYGLSEQGEKLLIRYVK